MFQRDKLFIFFHLSLFLLFLQVCSPPVKENLYYQPDEDLGQLFHDVQVGNVFSDSKTFVDCVPRKEAREIVKAYRLEKNKKDFDLKAFVKENFQLPNEYGQANIDPDRSSMESHIDSHWKYLTRKPDNKDEQGSLLHLPYPYVVPGGRFREIYYWDSYFTMLGLAVSNQEDLIQDMLNNFTYLIDEYGHIPNGNRTYYLSRSQPPFYSSMVMLYAQVKDLKSAARFLPQLEKEYHFWMDGKDVLEGKNAVYRRLVRMPDGSLLNRYWDDKNTPRPESYIEDIHLAENLPDNKKPQLYRNIRAACESGWDFSSRWFKDPSDMGSIITTEILPVDLNSLLYHLEKTIGILYEVKGNKTASENYFAAAQARKSAINKYFWNEEKGFFYDYNFIEQHQTDVQSLAGMYPLYFNIASEGQGKDASQYVKNNFFRNGGAATTTLETGQQWDYPNGWAPLQWITIKGLENYHFQSMADMIKKRWLSHNETVFKDTGKMMEKYNVADPDLEGGGGEYPLQDGFGWTNGVNLALIREW